MVLGVHDLVAHQAQRLDLDLAVTRPLVDGGDPHLAADVRQHLVHDVDREDERTRRGRVHSLGEVDSAAMKASCGTSTRPTIFIRFLPSFCFSSSLRLREMSPP